jgi:hypothetical protein
MESGDSLHCSQKPHESSPSYFLEININLLKADRLTAKLLLVLASTVIFGSDFHGSHDHTLLTDDSGSLQTTFF